MHYTNFGPLGMSVSALGFGCAPIGSRYGRRESLRTLGVAFDLGINYFDVARSYGYGDAEGIVGQFISNKRERVVVATKFGIDPPQASRARRLVKAVARELFRAAPALRVVARQSLGRQFTHGSFDVQRMTQSVETSLRQLQTDRIDVLLIHDCSPEAIEDDALFRGLETLVTAGKVRWVGASGERAVVREALRRRPVLRVAQSRHGVFETASEWRQSSTEFAHVVYHPFGGGEGLARLRGLLRHVREDVTAPNQLRRKLLGALDDEAIGVLAFWSARALGGADVVLASMFTHGHIEANVRASGWGPPSASDLAYLQGLVRTAQSPRD
jgi:aryl-alcohol dehydrogenase-like predicted oxidoreductase